MPLARCWMLDARRESSMEDRFNQKRPTSARFMGTWPLRIQMIPPSPYLWSVGDPIPLCLYAYGVFTGRQFDIETDAPDLPAIHPPDKAELTAKRPQTPS
jgi:hypothetical protein